MPPPRDNAATRAKAGQVTTTTVTIERPETEIRGPSGDVQRLPRRRDDADVLVYKKVNSHLLHPSTGQRLRYGQLRSSTTSGRPKTLSFGAAAITAFVGFRVCQLLVRCFRKRKPTQQEQEELLIQQALEQQQMQQMPPLRVMPAMLQRALPKLGPPRRPKRLAEQQRSRQVQRGVPNARQKMQLQGVVQRKALTLEKWHAAVQRQAQALMALEQQQQQHPGLSEAAGSAAAALPCSRASAVLPLPGVGNSLLLHPQPMLDVAEVAAPTAEQEASS